MLRRVLFILVILISVSQLFAIEPFEIKSLRVGVAYSPPYLIRDEGHLSGVCIDLWRLMCDTLNQSYEIVVYEDHDSLISDLRSGKIDLSICPYTATTERLKDFRMTIPFYISNMGIVSRAENHRPVLQTLQHIFSWTVVKWMILILGIVSVFAFFLWLAERKANAGQFHPGLRGVLDGVWWAFVTMSTVGYGDKIPKTSGGKILAITWMFFAISLFFVASGVISSELTLNKLQSRIHSTSDLTHCRVGAVAHSGYAELLTRMEIPYTSFSHPESGLQALEQDSIDAFVYDLSLLNYVLTSKKNLHDFVVIPSGLNLQYFSFLARKDNLQLVDQLNPALLAIIDSDGWEEILARYGLNK